MKKIVAVLIALAVVMSPIGGLLLNDPTSTAEAKGYKSGKRSFNTNQNQHQFNKPRVEKKKEENTSFTKSPNKVNTANNVGKKGGFFSGGLMKGLFVGGLAGLLFGSLFANMGVLGSILGFAINAFAIVFLVVIIRKVFDLLKQRKQKEEVNPWRS